MAEYYSDDGTHCRDSKGVIYKSTTTSASCTITYGKSDTKIFAFKKNSNVYEDITTAIATTSVTEAYLYQCTKDGCNQLISTNYLAVVDTDKKFYVCDGDGKCTNTGTPAAGYYLSGVKAVDDTFSSLIYCQDTTVGNCESVSSINEGFYLSSDSSFKLIECTNNKICKNYSSAIDSNSYYNDAAITTNIIKCVTSASCASIVGQKGYYKNSGDSTNNSCLECGSSSCTVKKKFKNFLR